MSHKVSKKWISITRSCRRLHVSKESMLRIAEVEGLTRRQFPGLNRLDFLLEDIERVEARSVIVPSPTRQPATV